VPFFAAAFSDELGIKLIEGKAKYDPQGINEPRKSPPSDLVFTIYLQRSSIPSSSMPGWRS